jgi:DNA-binding MarR family transcriptional regulator
MQDQLDVQRAVFARLFKVANALQVFLDRTLHEYGITGKQLFLMIVIGSFAPEAPSFKETAERGGSSYQNVKQLALKLEKSGYLRIVQDPNDARTKRLVTTARAEAFWAERSSRDIEAMDALFQGFSLQELQEFLDYLFRIEAQIETMESEVK